MNSQSCLCYGAPAERMRVLDLSPGSCKILCKCLIFEGFPTSSGVPQGVLSLLGFCDCFWSLLLSSRHAFAFALLPQSLCWWSSSLGWLPCLFCCYLRCPTPPQGCSICQHLQIFLVASLLFLIFLLSLPSFLGLTLRKSLSSVICGGLSGGSRTFRRVLPSLRGSKLLFALFALLPFGMSRAGWPSRLGLSPLLDSVVAHCFRVAVPSDQYRKLQHTVICSQLGRLTSWTHVLLDRGAEIASWPADVRALDELAVFGGSMPYHPPALTLLLGLPQSGLPGKWVASSVYPCWLVALAQLGALG